jgi:hypothetical protein
MQRVRQLRILMLMQFLRSENKPEEEQVENLVSKDKEMKEFWKYYQDNPQKLNEWMERAWLLLMLFLMIPGIAFTGFIINASNEHIFESRKSLRESQAYFEEIKLEAERLKMEVKELKSNQL